MKKIIIWGAGIDYLKRRQYVEYEVKKNGIEIVAFCTRDLYANTIDGRPVYSSLEQVKEKYDYVLVFSDKYFEEIKSEIIQSGVDNKRILDSQMLETYGFDFSLYFDLIENPVTIVTQDCMAALIYSKYMLPFTSPFILTGFKPDEYIKLLENWDVCINSCLRLGTEADPFREVYAQGILGSGGIEVWVDLYHYKDFASALEAWERRKKRINIDRILFIGQISNEDTKNRFHSCDLPGRKVGFVTDPGMSDGKEFFYLPRYTWRALNQADKRGNKLGDYLRDMHDLSYSVDVLKMLTGRGDFIRETL